MAIGKAKISQGVVEVEIYIRQEYMEPNTIVDITRQPKNSFVGRTFKEYDNMTRKLSAGKKELGLQLLVYFLQNSVNARGKVADSLTVG